MKKSFWIVMGILFIFLVLSFLLLVNVGFLATIQYNYEKNVSFNNIDAIAKSTGNFGKNLIEDKPSGSDECHFKVFNVVDIPQNSFSISLENYVTSCPKVYSNMNFGNTYAYILTNNLDFSTENTKKLDILYEQENSLSCQGDSRYGPGGWSEISLEGPTSIKLFTSARTSNIDNPISSSAGQITITKSEEDFLITFEGKTKLIEIPEGNYELKISSRIIAPCTGGRATEQIKITRLIIEREKDPCENIECPDKCQNSIKYSNGYCSEGECIYEEETCTYGCSGDLCAVDKCEGVECEDKCENSIWYHDGVCNPATGSCDYSEDKCLYGCENEPTGTLAILESGGMCRDNPCTGVECEDYCSGTTLFYDGKCINGKCTNFKEKQYAEECGFEPTPWYKEWWVWVIGVASLITLIFIVSYLLKRNK